MWFIFWQSIITLYYWHISGCSQSLSKVTSRSTRNWHPLSDSPRDNSCKSPRTAPWWLERRSCYCGRPRSRPPTSPRSVKGHPNWHSSASNGAVLSATDLCFPEMQYTQISSPLHRCVDSLTRIGGSQTFLKSRLSVGVALKHIWKIKCTGMLSVSCVSRTRPWHVGNRWRKVFRTLVNFIICWFFEKSYSWYYVLLIMGSRDQ